MADPAHTKRIVVGITGASGALYARRLLQCLCARGATAHLIVSPHGQRLLHDELDVATVDPAALGVEPADRLVVHPYRDIGDVLASGSFHTDGMIICPCSSNTLAAVAAGLSDNLLHRAAAVTLKEARRLIVVPREMPMGHIDLQNALRLSEAGAIICPASPGFYMLPETVDDLVDFVAGKLLDLMGVRHDLATRWAGRVAGASDPTDAGADS